MEAETRLINSSQHGVILSWYTILHSQVIISSPCSSHNHNEIEHRGQKLTRGADQELANDLSGIPSFVKSSYQRTSARLQCDSL
jgi:hypothetical protein